MLGLRLVCVILEDFSVEWKCKFRNFCVGDCRFTESETSRFVVGSRLSDSFDVPPHTPSPQPPKSAVIVIIAARFFILGAIGILVTYLFAAKTKLLGDDPVLWWSMMLMPIGPPGMIVSVLLEVTNAETRAKMMVARMLAYNYLVTPLVALAIVCALRATEAAQKMHEYQ